MNTIGGMFKSVLDSTSPYSNKNKKEFLVKLDEIKNETASTVKSTAILVSGQRQLVRASYETNKNLKLLNRNVNKFKNETLSILRSDGGRAIKQDSLTRQYRNTEIQFQRDSRRYFRESSGFLYTLSKKQSDENNKGFGLGKFALTLGAAFGAEKLGEMLLGTKPSFLIFTLQSFFREGGLLSKIGTIMSEGFIRMGSWMKTLGESKLVTRIKNVFSEEGALGKLGAMFKEGGALSRFGALFKEGGALSGITTIFKTGPIASILKIGSKIFAPLTAIFGIFDGIEGIMKEGDKIGNTLAFVKYASAGFLGGFLDLGKWLFGIDNGQSGKKDILDFVDKAQLWLSDAMTSVDTFATHVQESWKYFSEGQWMKDLETWWKSWSVMDWGPIKTMKEKYDSIKNWMSTGFTDITNWWSNWSVSEWGPIKTVKGKMKELSDWWNNFSITGLFTSEKDKEESKKPPTSTDGEKGRNSSVFKRKKSPTSTDSAAGLNMLSLDIPNYSTSTDTEMGRLTPGEVVIPKDIAKDNAAGLNMMLAKIPAYAEGGVVPNPGSLPTVTATAGGVAGSLNSIDIGASKIKELSLDKAKIENINFGSAGEVDGFWDAFTNTLGIQEGGTLRKAVTETAEAATKKMEEWAGEFNSKVQQMMNAPSATQTEYSQKINEWFNKVTGGMISTMDETRIDFNDPSKNKAAFGYGNINAAQRLSRDRVGTGVGQTSPLNVAPGVTGQSKTGLSTPGQPSVPYTGDVPSGRLRIGWMKEKLRDAYLRKGYTPQQAEEFSTAGVGQYINETGWKKIDKGAAGHGKNNFFNIKQPAGAKVKGDLPATMHFDPEEHGGRGSTDPYANWSTPEKGAEGYIEFLEQNPRYKKALKTNSTEDFIAEVAAANFASDPQYRSKVTNISKGSSLAKELRKYEDYKANRPSTETAKASAVSSTQAPASATEAKPYALGNVTSSLSRENTMTAAEVAKWQTQTNAGIAVGRTLAEMRASSDQRVIDIANKVQLSSGNKGGHSKTGLHYTGNAADLNSQNLTDAEEAILASYAKKNNLLRDVVIKGKLEKWHYSYRGANLLNKDGTVKAQPQAEVLAAQNQISPSAQAELPAQPQAQAQLIAATNGAPVPVSIVSDLTRRATEEKTETETSEKTAQVDFLKESTEKMKTLTGNTLYSTPVAPASTESITKIANAGIRDEVNRFPLAQQNNKTTGKSDIAIMGGGSSTVSSVSGGTENYDLNPYSHMSEYMRMSMLRGVSAIPGAAVGY